MSDALVATVVKPMLVTAALPMGAAAVGVLASRLGRNERDPKRRLPGFGLAIGAIAAQVLIAGLPKLPPVDVVGWLPIGLAAACLVGWIESLRNWPWALREVLRAGCVAVPIVGLLRPFAKRWEDTQLVLWLLGCTALGLAIWWLLSKPARKAALPFALVPLTFAAGAFAGVMALSGSAKSSQLSGALAAGLGGLALAAFFRKLERVDGVVLAVGAVGLTCVLAHAQLYTDVHPISTALVALAAASGALGRLPLVSLLPRKKLLAAGIAAAALPAGAALLWAWSQVEPNPYAY